MASSLVAAAAIVVLLCLGAAAQGTTTVSTETTQNITAPETTMLDVTPSPTEPKGSESPHAAVVAVGVVCCIILAVVGFYLIIVWPKRSLMRYRMKYEAMIESHVDSGGAAGGASDFGVPMLGKHEGERVDPSTYLYGGASVERDAVGRAKIPTFKRIEQTKNASPVGKGDDKLTGQRPPAINV